MRALLILSLLAVAAPDRENPTPKKPVPPPNQILGEWKLERIMLGGGVPDTAPEIGNKSINITPTELIALENGEARPNDGARYTIDWTKKPVAIDLMPPNGPQKKIEGILKPEGDQLTICFTMDGTRPTEFTTATGKVTALMQLRRIKK
jgi:uncharacterized protein (TIGR03067 family)